MIGILIEQWPHTDLQRASKIVQKSILGPSWAPRWAQDGPRRPQRANLDDFWSILDRFWTEFGLNINRFWIEYGPNFDRIWNLFCAHFNSANVNSAHINPPTSARHTSTQHTETNIWAGGTREAITIRRAPGARRVEGFPEIPVPDQTWSLSGWHRETRQPPPDPAS